jgi:gamma-glutamylcyclotransferase (GGCT)/AIG2-like uncharacterized protein YtfP
LEKSIPGAQTVPDNPARLAVYGSLAPGKENHGQLAGLIGSWSKGTVRGKLHPEGWGATMGYPALILDPEGDEVEVNVFASPGLPSAWTRLDDFEGSGYQRVLTQVMQQGVPTPACIYVLAP